ncbi:hypothetical protein IFR04_014413 [Cadophora malorum]|uniref:Uncharacterized protein n=1 Tax=Cadophora malorum TaxID=108018 RepID=A0A8H7T2U3_9HELO|nr:hypothetical protein IFR04_014413 [Cadophora malorum]
MGGRYQSVGPVLAAIYRPEEESGHRRVQESQWYQPLVMKSSTFDSRLPLTEIHQACNKACAIYCIPKIHIGMSGFWRAVYNKWFVPNEVDIEFGTFFAQFIACWDDDSAKQPDAILTAHKKLCEQVESRQKILDEIDAEEIEPFTEWHEYFELGLSFRSAVIVVDREDWENDGVLLLRTSDTEGLAKWPIDVNDEKIQAGLGVDGGAVTRLSLESAIDVLLEMYRQSESESQKARRLKPNDPLHVCVF